MSGTRPSTAALAPLLTGVGALLAGALLPWIRPGARVATRGDGPPDVYVPGMYVGLERIDVLVVLPVILALGLLALGGRPQFRGAGAVVAGVLTLFVAGRYVFTRTLVGFDATFVPSYGWYLTVLGGCLVAGAGVVDLVRNGSGRDRDAPDEAPQE